MTMVTGGDYLGSDVGAKASALAVFRAAASGLLADDWHGLVGFTCEEAAKGADVRGISFKDMDHAVIDVSRPIAMTLLSFGHVDQSTHLVSSVVDNGRFLFLERDGKIPAQGSKLAQANDKLSTREVLQDDRLLAAALVTPQKPGSLIPIEAFFATSGRTSKVFVSTSELAGALGYATINKGGEAPAFDPTVMSGVMKLAPAVVQPIYSAELKPLGFAQTGQTGMDALFRGFGLGSVRALQIDRERAGTITDGSELLTSLVAATEGRNLKRVSREAFKGRLQEGIGR